MVPFFDPVPPQYFVKVISDKWLQAEHVIPVIFHKLVLPHKFPAPTPLLQLPLRSVEDLEFEEAISVLEGKDSRKEFSAVQT